MKRLSVCEGTTVEWSFEEDINYYSKKGINTIGIIYNKIRNKNIKDLSKKINQKGFKVSSLSCTGFFTIPEEERKNKEICIEDPVNAVEIAKEIGAETLIVVSGPPNFGKGGIFEAETKTLEGLKGMVTKAEELGIRVALEVIHPMYIDTWTAITTIGQAMDIIEKINSDNIGIFIDLYHIFWDPKVFDGLKRAKGKIFGIHISDWRTPTRNLNDRDIVGSGIIPVKNILSEIIKVGYKGYFEYEILTDDYNAGSYPNLLNKIISSYRENIEILL